jgi:hypothetical protein
VTTEIKDTAVAANDAQRAAAEFGYTRMWSIHPNQIKPIIKTFTPRLSEVSEPPPSCRKRPPRNGARSRRTAACTTAPATDIIGPFYSAPNWPG